jgi:hypothetical protein
MSTARAYSWRRWLALLLLAPSAAAADPCASARPEAGVPVRAPLGPAGFGTLPEACAATETSVVGTAAALIARRDFYGSLHASLAPRLRAQLPGGSWLSLAAPGLDYWLVANASIEAESTSVGPAALGWHMPLGATETLQIAPYARVLLGSPGPYRRATQYGLEHGLSAVWQPAPSLELVGGLSFPLLVAHNAGTMHVAYVPGIATDLGLVPWHWLSVTGGLGARVRAGDDSGFESLDLRAALRLYPWRGALVDTSLVLPTLGHDRTDFGLNLILGWIW